MLMSKVDQYGHLFDLPRNVRDDTTHNPSASTHISTHTMDLILPAVCDPPVPPLRPAHTMNVECRSELCRVWQ